MYGLENRFKMQVLLGLKRAHCEMGIQQPRTTSLLTKLLDMVRKSLGVGYIFPRRSDSLKGLMHGVENRFKMQLLLES